MTGTLLAMTVAQLLAHVHIHPRPDAIGAVIIHHRQPDGTYTHQPATLKEATAL